MPLVRVGRRNPVAYWHRSPGWSPSNLVNGSRGHYASKRRTSIFLLIWSSPIREIAIRQRSRISPVRKLPRSMCSATWANRTAAPIKTFLSAGAALLLLACSHAFVASRNFSAVVIRGNQSELPRSINLRHVSQTRHKSNPY